MTVNRLIYLPLGGAGEIGMNCYVYGYGPEDRERLIVVDLGVTFPDMDSTPGVDLIMADISWLEQRRDRIEAIFITHAHEDHIGALGLLWPRLKVPVYARRFTAVLGKLKLEENGLPGHTITVVRPRPETVEAGPFRVQFVPVAHSIPESAALIIDTPAARIVHSGDFKLDETPLVGEGWNPGLFREIAAERPVKALMCDSTNVFSLHPGRSESTLREPIRALIAGASGMVVATTFASNVARLRTLAEAAQAMRAEISNGQSQLDDASRDLVERGLAVWSEDAAARPVLIVRGAANLLDETALGDIERVRSLLEDLENKQSVAQLLDSAREAEATRIFIGSENRLFALSGSSVIASPDRDREGRVVGVLGVIGPTRLNYARVVPMVDLTARSLGKLIA
jgi:glyoxylase-like metal-dependent hydrolase (beta-lactamase superfamily II)